MFVVIKIHKFIYDNTGECYVEGCFLGKRKKKLFNYFTLTREPQKNSKGPL